MVIEVEKLKCIHDDIRSNLNEYSGYIAVPVIDNHAESELDLDVKYDKTIIDEADMVIANKLNHNTSD